MRADEKPQQTNPVRAGVGWLVAVVAGLALVAPGTAGAAACSTATGAAGCTVTANVTVTAGTLALKSPASLFWNFVANGYDQWASGSATALTGCTASGTTTECSSGTAPRLVVLDATGSSSGWSLSAYVPSSTLPTGTVLTFNGSGSATIGNSVTSPIGVDPFSGSTPSIACDYASTCTTATPAAACSHADLGFTTCPSYAVAVSGTTAGTQADLYSAAASSGMGANCFASGAATATGCAGTTSDAYFNLGLKSNAPAGDTSAQLNLAVTSGP